MSGFFITGTDTDVGKTITAAVLMLALKGMYWKPIQSGVRESQSDSHTVKEFTQLPDTHFYSSNYVFQAALSPDQAALLENVTIDITTCDIPKTTHPLIVEGAGGVFVPINQHDCMLDFIKKLNLPVIIVSRGTLGTINHTLLTIEALRNRQVDIQGVVFNGKLDTRNKEAIERWGQVKTLFHIPHFEILTKEIVYRWTMQHQKKIVENVV